MRKVGFNLLVGSALLKTASFVGALGLAFLPAQTAAQSQYESGILVGHGTYHGGKARSAPKSKSNTFKGGKPQGKAVPVPAFMRSFRKPREY
jgi:hypothetical protein